MEPGVLNPAYSIINLLLWFIFLFFFLIPILRRYVLNKARETLIRALEERMQSRVITLIHRQESVGFFGIPIIRYISIRAWFKHLHRRARGTGAFCSIHTNSIQNKRKHLKNHLVPKEGHKETKGPFLKNFFYRFLIVCKPNYFSFKVLKP